MFKVLRPLTWSRDGVTPLHSSAGDEFDPPADLVPGLLAEGYIEEMLPPEPPMQGVDIDEAWREMPWPAMRSLAAQFGASSNKDEAIATIEAEIARRTAEVG